MRKTKCIFCNITDPLFNISADRFILRLAGAGDGLFVRFYVNVPSVVLGAHQCEELEVNSAYCRANGIKVVRRISGGGAVYHDEGNLNIAVALNKTLLPEKYIAENVHFFASLLKDALNSFALGAEVGVHNEILINGKKVSGSAACQKYNGFLFHATLLLNADLDKMRRALHVENDTPITHRRCVRSNRAEVANIYDIKKIDKNTLISRMCDALSSAF
jgi:lipoate-protein ligase A